MAEVRATTTTTTTTTTTRRTTTITIDGGFLVPHGILKILEILFCIVILALTADKRPGCLGSKCSDSYHGVTFAMAVAIIFFLTTLIMFIIFLLTLPEKTCGRSACNMIDLILNVIAVITMFISFVLLCLYCDFWLLIPSRSGGFYKEHYIVEELLAAAIFAVVNFVLYILSIVFAMKTGRSPIVIKA